MPNEDLDRLVRAADRVGASDLHLRAGSPPRVRITASSRPSRATASDADSEWYGMQTFDQSLASLFEQGSIDLDDTIAAASNPHDIAVQLRRTGALGTGAA